MGAADRQLRGAIAIGLLGQAPVDPTDWLELDQALRRIDFLGDPKRIHELVAASVVGLAEIGFASVIHIGDLRRTLSAASVLWRASFSYGRALAYVDADGATIHVTGDPAMTEAAGQLHAGWCLGLARMAGAAIAQVELRRRPWADEGDEQVIRLHCSSGAKLAASRPSTSPA